MILVVCHRPRHIFYACSCNGNYIKIRELYFSGLPWCLHGMLQFLKTKPVFMAQGVKSWLLPPKNRSSGKRKREGGSFKAYAKNVLTQIVGQRRTNRSIFAYGNSQKNQWKMPITVFFLCLSLNLAPKRMSGVITQCTLCCLHCLSLELVLRISTVLLG